MRGHVRRRVGGRSDRVVICDSKQAYAGGRRDAGLAVLERAVLGFLASAGIRPRTLAELLEQTSVGPAASAGTAGKEKVERRPPESAALALGDLETAPGGSAVSPLSSLLLSCSAAAEPPPWHRPEALRLPVRAEPERIAEAAGALAKGFAALGGRAGRLWVSLTPASRLNRLMDGGGRNKASALFAVTAELLAGVRHWRPAEPIFATMDQHGGRRYYADLLAGAFPMHRVETLEESAERSRYRLAGAQAVMDLTVCQKAESSSLAAALASMAAKYVRELVMGQLNAYFQARVPNLAPTAGYGRDAWRFLAEVRSAQAEADIPIDMILRSR
jgi:hypothetical protein